MTTKRRLSDLFVVGRAFIVDDGQGDPISVWLQKLNPVEHSEAVRYADAERARVRTLSRYPDSDEYKLIRATAASIGDRDELTNFVVAEQRLRAEATQEAKLAAEEEWSKDNYLQGLQDSWESSFKTRYAEDPEDPEAKRVFEEMKRFADELEARVADEIDSLVDSFSSLPMEDLEERAVQRMLDGQATQAWLTHFWRAQLYYGTRLHEVSVPADQPHPEHTERYFEDMEEVRTLQAETMNQLRNAWNALEVPITEGKDLQEAPSSSPSSEQHSEAETGASSGQLVSVP